MQSERRFTIECEFLTNGHRYRTDNQQFRIYATAETALTSEKEIAQTAFREFEQNLESSVLEIEIKEKNYVTGK